MLLISHRGNISGPQPDFENNPRFILDAMNKGYDVEVDLRFKEGELYLGHDFAEHRINYDFLELNSHKLWVHCKDALSLSFCMNFQKINFFWHQEDDYTLTSKNIVWAYPGQLPVSEYTIMVMPEVVSWSVQEVYDMQPYGVCSDYVFKYDVYGKN
jgi:hypothetical protein